MAARKELSGIDLAQSSLLNPVAHPLSAAPSAPKFGQFYYNTTSNILFVWNGTSWRPVDAAGLTDGSVPIAALATNPLARVNHTGTQLAATISDLATTVQAYRLDQFAAPVGPVAFGGQRITGGAPGVAGTDFATVQQLADTLTTALAGIDPKPSVRTYADTNITLSGTQTVTGVALLVGDRVLAGAQTDGTKNGSYIVASSAWARAPDADQQGEITAGAEWFVEEGTYKGTKWRVNNTGTITLGTTSIIIGQSQAAGVYSASPTGGLSLTGTAFAVLLPALSGLATTAGGLTIDPTIVVKKYAVTLTGDGSTTSFTVTHGLNTQDITAAFRDANNVAVGIDWSAATVNTMTVNFAVAPSSGTTYRAVVHG